jgi:FkbM family methyltransferase
MITNIRLKILEKIVDVYEYFFYDNKLKKVLKSIKLDSVFDVGSNKGGFIDLVLRVNPSATIHAFEPNPVIFKLLLRKFTFAKVKLNNCAISDSIEKKIFYENIFNLTSSLEKPDLESKHSQKKIKTFGIKPEELIKNTYEVDTITLSNYIKIHTIKEIDYIKIDTEGHEFECLKGLFDNLTCMIKYIQVEEHITESHSQSVLESKKILAQNQFVEFKRIKHHLGKFFDVIYINNTL